MRKESGLARGMIGGSEKVKKKRKLSRTKERGAGGGMSHKVPTLSRRRGGTGGRTKGSGEVQIRALRERKNRKVEKPANVTEPTHPGAGGIVGIIGKNRK